jgi:hypothetical protein
MKNILLGLICVMLFAAAAWSQAPIQRPRPEVLQTQVQRDLDDLNAKVKQLQTQVAQMQAHGAQVDVSVKIAYDNGKIIAGELGRVCHWLSFTANPGLGCNGSLKTVK